MDFHTKKDQNNNTELIFVNWGKAILNLHFLMLPLDNLYCLTRLLNKLID